MPRPHTLRKAGDHLEQETQTPERLYQAVVDYAFGSGDRGKTLVGHDPSGRMFDFPFGLCARDPKRDLCVRPHSLEGQYRARYTTVGFRRLGAGVSKR